MDGSAGEVAEHVEDYAAASGGLAVDADLLGTAYVCDAEPWEPETGPVPSPKSKFPPIEDQPCEAAVTPIAPFACVVMVLVNIGCNCAAPLS